MYFSYRRCPECGRTGNIVETRYKHAIEKYELCRRCGYELDKFKEESQIERFQEYVEITTCSRQIYSPIFGDVESTYRTYNTINNVWKINSKCYSSSINEAKSILDAFLWVDDSGREPRDIYEDRELLCREKVNSLLQNKSLRAALSDRGDKSKCARRNIESLYDYMCSSEKISSEAENIKHQYLLELYEEDHGEFEGIKCFSSPLVEIFLPEFAINYDRDYIAHIKYVNVCTNKRIWVQFMDTPYYKEWLNADEYSLRVKWFPWNKKTHIEFAIGTDEGVCYRFTLTFTAEYTDKFYGNIACTNSILTPEQLAEVSCSSNNISNQKILGLKHMHAMKILSDYEYRECLKIVTRNK